MMIWGDQEEWDDVLLDLSAAVRLVGSASYPQRRRRAVVLMTLGRYPEAKHELEQALESVPDHFSEFGEISAELVCDKYEFCIANEKFCIKNDEFCRRQRPRRWSRCRRCSGRVRFNLRFNLRFD